MAPFHTPVPAGNDTFPAGTLDYYFGDYYAASYSHGGFYASFSFQSSRYGYDPIYSHQRWEHRQDREWEHHVAASYEYRRDHETARPPRTWAAQRTINPVTAASPHPGWAPSR